MIMKKLHYRLSMLDGEQRAYTIHLRFLGGDQEVEFAVQEHTSETLVVCYPGTTQSIVINPDNVCWARVETL